MGRVLPVLIAIILAVYCLVDVVQRSSDEVRYLPRWAWGIIILLVPLIGPIGYLIAGRPQKDQPGGAVGPARGGPPPSSIAPDDDPEFLNEIRKRRQREQEEKLRRWEQELEERERHLQQPRDDDDNGKPPTAGAG